VSTVRLDNVTKRFGSTCAVRDIDLAVESGAFFTLLGPSGCGKTTLLRILSGFEAPTHGRVFLDGEDVTFRAPEKRNVGMVFQNYALFPHLTVAENVAYGLRVRRLGARAIKERVAKYLAVVRLEGYGGRRIAELSGGQQQRVALARSLAVEPRILLLDEPLSNLDARLRESMRLELKELQKTLGITTVYVTHDQTEALTMSDRIAVLNDGVCHQVGTPRDVYDRPANAFVARFVGETNLFPLSPDGRYAEVSATARLACEAGLRAAYVSVRPEGIRIAREPGGGTHELNGVVDFEQFNGAMSFFLVRVSDRQIRVLRPHNAAATDDFRVGERVFLTIDPRSMVLVPEA